MRDESMCTGWHGARQRNYSPWFQWMTWLMATGHDDPLDVADLSGFEAWRERRRTRLAELLGPVPGPGPARPRGRWRPSDGDGYRREKIVFDTEDTMSVPAYLLVPDGRALPGAGRAGRPRPRPRQVAGVRPGADRGAGRRLRRPAGRGGATWCWRPTCAASASGPTGTRRTTTAATPTWSTP